MLSACSLFRPLTKLRKLSFASLPAVFIFHLPLYASPFAVEQLHPEFVIILLNSNSQNNGKCFMYTTSLVYATIGLEGGHKHDDWREIKATAKGARLDRR